MFNFPKYDRLSFRVYGFNKSGDPTITKTAVIKKADNWESSVIKEIKYNRNNVSQIIYQWGNIVLTYIPDRNNNNKMFHKLSIELYSSVRLLNTFSISILKGWPKLIPFYNLKSYNIYYCFTQQWLWFQSQYSELLEQEK